VIKVERTVSGNIVISGLTDKEYVVLRDMLIRGLSRSVETGAIEEHILRHLPKKVE